jgi:hypothetical protein
MVSLMAGNKKCKGAVTSNGMKIYTLKKQNVMELGLVKTMEAVIM